MNEYIKIAIIALIVVFLYDKFIKGIISGNAEDSFEADFEE